jgi:hypothetical protein
VVMFQVIVGVVEAGDVSCRYVLSI